MSETNIGRAMGIDGPGTHFLETSERTWIFVDPTQEDKNEFAQWCRTKIVKEHKELMRIAPEDTREMMSVIMADFAAGVYDWRAWQGPGEGCIRLLRSIPGLIKFIEILLRHKHPYVTEEECSNIVDKHTAEVAKIVAEAISVPPSSPMKDKKEAAAETSSANTNR